MFKYSAITQVQEYFMLCLTSKESIVLLSHMHSPYLFPNSPYLLSNSPCLPQLRKRKRAGTDTGEQASMGSVHVQKARAGDDKEHNLSTVLYNKREFRSDYT